MCTSNLDLVSFLFVPALYSTFKLEIFPFTCNIIGIAMVFGFSPYIREIQFLFSFKLYTAEAGLANNTIRDTGAIALA